MELSKLENSDTIVLLGIIYASEFGTKKINIAQIVSSFDFIEHAIISYEELKGALCRLSANNYVKESKHLEFLPSESVIEHLKFLKKQEKNLT